MRRTRSARRCAAPRKDAPRKTAPSVYEKDENALPTDIKPPSVRHRLDAATASRKRPHRAETKAQGAPGIIVLTGERHSARYEIKLSGKTVALTFTMLNAVVGMIIARASPGSGFFPVSRVTINRLRETIDRVLRPGAGESLIETGCREEYRLTIAAERLGAQVVIDSSFFELEGWVVAHDKMETLRRLCAHPAIGLKPRRYRKEIGERASLG